MNTDIELEKITLNSCSDSDRPSGYQYFKILSEHLGGDLTKIFNGELIYPRQIEIHLPGDHKQACNFNCYYCQGRRLEQPLYAFEEDALNLVDELKGRVPYFIYGGAYSEPLLNPYFMKFLKLTKKHGSYFGIHTNGSLLKELERKESFITNLCRISTSEQDYISISLDGGTPESHMKTKNIKMNWFDEILKGIKLAIEKRGDSQFPAIRVCYLMNKFNASVSEIIRIIDIMQQIKVDSLRFSIPYDLYGKEFNNVRKYKQLIESKQNVKYTKMLKPLVSKELNAKPYIFYLSPEYQDVDSMNYDQCIYCYYQITLAADGYVYKCSSTASPSFKMNRLGRIPRSLASLKEMILKNCNSRFTPSTCFRVGARCNRIALEINTAWKRKGGNGQY